jgi:hypothetical protein
MLLWDPRDTKGTEDRRGDREGRQKDRRAHGAHFALKGTQSKRSVTRVRNKRLDLKKHAPGFGRCDFSLASGSRGGD